MSRGSKILELRRQTWLKRATPTSAAFVQASERSAGNSTEPNRAGDRPGSPAASAPPRHSRRQFSCRPRPLVSRRRASPTWFPRSASCSSRGRCSFRRRTPPTPCVRPHRERAGGARRAPRTAAGGGRSCTATQAPAPPRRAKGGRRARAGRAAAGRQRRVSSRTGRGHPRALAGAGAFCAALATQPTAVRRRRPDESRGFDSELSSNLGCGHVRG